MGRADAEGRCVAAQEALAARVEEMELARDEAHNAQAALQSQQKEAEAALKSQQEAAEATLQEKEDEAEGLADANAELLLEVERFKRRKDHFKEKAARVPVLKHQLKDAKR